MSEIGVDACPGRIFVETIENRLLRRFMICLKMTHLHDLRFFFFSHPPSSRAHPYTSQERVKGQNLRETKQQMDTSSLSFPLNVNATTFQLPGVEISFSQDGNMDFSGQGCSSQGVQTEICDPSVMEGQCNWNQDPVSGTAEEEHSQVFSGEDGHPEMDSENPTPIDEESGNQDGKRQQQGSHTPVDQNPECQAEYEEQRYPTPADENPGTGVEYEQRGYPLPMADENPSCQPEYEQGHPPPPHDPNFQLYYNSDTTSPTTTFMNDPGINYYPGSISPIITTDYFQQFQTYPNDTLAQTQQQYFGRPPEPYWQNNYPQIHHVQKPTKSRSRYSASYHQLGLAGRPSVDIVDVPSNSLTEERRRDYEVFKEYYARLLGGQISSDVVTEERQQRFERVVCDYATYAGIPSYVNYILGEYDGDFLHPRRLPTHRVLELSNPKTIMHIRQIAAEFTAYHQSMEWDRTNGWSDLERVSLIDVEARTIAQPRPINSIQQQGGGPITTIYVVLMHDVPNMQVSKEIDETLIPCLDSKETDATPIPCLESMGDILEVVCGEKRCRVQTTNPPFIPHKLKGEIPLCGFKKVGKGRTRTMVIRGRQDVCKMYETIHRRSQQSINK